jgi:hypothetical protein
MCSLSVALARPRQDAARTYNAVTATTRFRRPCEENDLGSRRLTPWQTLFADAPEIGRHTVASALAILSIWLVHHVLDLLLGADALLFDALPARYMFDAGHLCVGVKLAYHVLRQIWSPHK